MKKRAKRVARHVDDEQPARAQPVAVIDQQQHAAQGQVPQRLVAGTSGGRCVYCV